MNVHASGRAGDGRVAGRSKISRITVALLATVALCLGPAISASADEGAGTLAAEGQNQSVEGTSEAALLASSGDGSEEGTVEEPVVEEVVDEVVDEVANDEAIDTGGDSGIDESLEENTDGSDSAGDGGNETVVDDSMDTGVAGNDEAVDDATTDSTLLSVGTNSLGVTGKSNGNDGDNGHQAVLICHVTSSDTNPYNLIPVDANSIFKTNGHDQHTKAGGTLSDIIPVFWYVKNENKHEYTYPGNGTMYPGKNLGNGGAEMLANDCNQPPEPPECPVYPDHVALMSSQGDSDDCPEPPECPDVASVTSSGDHGDQGECPEPPECPDVTVLSFSGDHGDPGDCPEPPVCPTDQGPQPLTLSSDRGPDWNDDGKNWECPKIPEIEVIPGDCIVVGDNGEAGYEVMGNESVAHIIGSNLKPGRDYEVVVWFDGNEVFSDTFEADDEGMIEAWPSLTEVGGYVATITSLGHKPRSASAEFNVSECPPVVPQVVAVVATCVGGDLAQALQATIKGAQLEPGETYSLMVTGPAGFAWNGSLTGSEAGTAEVMVALGANGTYAAALEGTPTVEFAAAKTCTPKPVTPAAGPALANTGSSDLQPLMWGGMLALLVAAGLMLQPLRTKRTKR